METASELAARMDSMPQVYGNIQYVYNYNDSDISGSSSQHADNGSTLGVKHDHEIAPGVTGFFKLELDGFGADEKDSDGANIDEAYIGLKGDSFGQVWIGSDDSIYESQLGDYGNWVFEFARLNPYASYTTGEGDMIQYMSPSFGGLTFSGAVQIRGDGDSSYSGGDEERPYQFGVMATYNLGANTFRAAYELAETDTDDLEVDVISLQALHNVPHHMYVSTEVVRRNNDNGAAKEEINQLNVGAVYYF